MGGHFERGRIGPGDQGGIGIGPEPTGFTLAPNGTKHFEGSINVQTLLLPDSFSKAPSKLHPALPEILAGKAALYFSEGVAYHDIFGREHSSEECLAYDPTSKHFYPC